MEKSEVQRHAKMTRSQAFHVGFGTCASVISLRDPLVGWYAVLPGWALMAEYVIPEPRQSGSDAIRVTGRKVAPYV